MPYGFDDTGFELKPQSIIQQEMETYIRNNGVSNYKLLPDTPDGQILLIVANEIAKIFEQMQVVYHSFIPSFSEGVQLDNVNEIRAIYRKQATKSTITATVAGAAGTTVPTGSIASTSSNNDKFLTKETVVIPNLGGGLGSINVEMESEEYGPIIAYSGTLTVIETPIAGWESIINISDAALGEDQESDVDFRARAEKELALNGKATLDAIRSNLYEVPNVESVYIFENNSVVEDGEGRPAKSFEVIIQGGDNFEIAQKIWQIKPCGIETFSTANVSVIPIMTANNAPEGTVSATAEVAGNEAYKAADGNASTYWQINDTAGYWQYQMSRGRSVLIFSVKSAVDSAANAPKDFKIQGSLDGSDWDDLKEVTGETGWNAAGEERLFICNYFDEEYTYYRIDISDNNGGASTRVAEFGFLAYKFQVEVEDTQGFSHIIDFSRPIEIPVYVEVDVEQPSEAAVDLDDQIAANIIEYTQNFGIGRSVESTELYTPVYETFEGLKASNLKIDITPSPAGTQIIIESNQVPTFDVSRIKVNLV